VISGVDSTLPLFRRLVQEPDILSGNYTIHWLERWLAAQAE
jgi:acetyl-CoA carboxylase biotin carboxylase subunit